MFEPSLVYQHLTVGRGGAINVQFWQVVNLVGAPLAAVVLLPPVIDDLERWWTRRAEAKAESRTAGKARSRSPRRGDPPRPD